MRCLIIGCGCRGRMLAGALVAEGHAVRGTTRDRARLPEIAKTGAEAIVGDPDRVATLIDALDHVAVVCILLASAMAPPEQLLALHGSRLEMLLRKLIDTTVRGVVYEAHGTVDPETLRTGSGLVRAFGERSRSRIALLEADRSRPGEWLAAALDAIEQVVAYTEDRAEIDKS